jgi:hypothetical protein
MGGPAQALNPPSMFGMRSVRKIQASYVHAGAHQRENHCLGITGGTYGADDLCTAYAFGQGLGLSAGCRQALYHQIQSAFFQGRKSFSLQAP